MHLIEPCCTQKHIARLRKALGEDGTDFFHGYGDLSLTEILPVILMHYSGEADLLLVVPALPDTVTELLATWMRKQWPKIDGSGKVYVIGHLMLIAPAGEQVAAGIGVGKKQSVSRAADSEGRAAERHRHPAARHRPVWAHQPDVWRSLRGDGNKKRKDDSDLAGDV